MRREVEALAYEQRLAVASGYQQPEWNPAELDEVAIGRQVDALVCRNAKRIDALIADAAVVTIGSGLADAVMDWLGEPDFLLGAHKLTLEFDPVFIDTEDACGVSRVAVLGRERGTGGRAPRSEFNLAGCLAWTEEPGLFLAPFAQPLDQWQDIHLPFAVVHVARDENQKAQAGDIYLPSPGAEPQFPVTDMADADGLRWTPFFASFVAARRAVRLIQWLGEVGLRQQPDAVGTKRRYVPCAQP